MKRVIIGTAGHIDHGKTALVKALTGVDTDRLKEEKQRGISIELGFAPLDFSSGQRAGIVDVPGHERFISQMLAGASGMDMVILVIAADEGVMPQTREHVDIIQLLGIERGVVAITKIDLVDEDWLMLVEDEVREYLAETSLKGAPIVPVSAVTGEGIPELMRVLQTVALQAKEKPGFGKARLPIDRVFTVTGFGTVVTGTLWSGEINAGDSLEILPPGLAVRVRNLQVHGNRVETARAGQRVAVNLQGAEVEQIKRGFVLASPGFLIPSYRVDTVFRLLKSSPRRVRNWTRIHFHLGTDEALGRVVLLDRDELLPGEETYAQIVMEKPVVAYKKDRFVARFYSPVITIGGGVVIDPNPPKQKRFKEEVLASLAVKEGGTLADVIREELESHSDKLYSLAEIAREVGAGEDRVQEELEALVKERVLERLEVEGRQYFMSGQGLRSFETGLRELLEDYHRRFPLRRGYPREELRSKHLKKYPPKVAGGLLQLLETRGSISIGKNHVAIPGFRPGLNSRQQQSVEFLIAEFTRQPFTPPDLKEICERIGMEADEFNEVVNYLLESGALVKAADNAYFSSTAVEEGKKLLEAYFAEHREITLAAARDLFASSRKHTLPLMEYYDRIRFTKRVGDIRVKFG